MFRSLNFLEDADGSPIQTGTDFPVEDYSLQLGDFYIIETLSHVLGNCHGFQNNLQKDCHLLT
jgi:hypothetical protein